MHILPYWKIAIEILILWYVLYMMLYLIRGTRTEQLLKGLLIIGVLSLFTQQLQLDVINWLLTRIFPISIIALLVIFQPELRRGLVRLGQFGMYQEEMEVIEEIAKAGALLSKKKNGALIAIEREVGLKTYIENGTVIDSKVTTELILSLFLPQSPLHDGAVIIQRDRLAAAACLLPLSQETGISKSLGTRHRAAIGLSEETDAVCIAVSEENGAISVALGGKITRGLDEEGLVKTLKNIFYRPRRAKAHLRALSRISPKPTQEGRM